MAGEAHPPPPPPPPFIVKPSAAEGLDPPQHFTLPLTLLEDHSVCGINVEDSMTKQYKLKECQMIN